MAPVPRTGGGSQQGRRRRAGAERQMRHLGAGSGPGFFWARIPSLGRPGTTTRDNPPRNGKNGPVIPRLPTHSGTFS